MDIRIKTSDYSITPQVSEYLEDKLAVIGKLLAERESLARCEVELGRAIGRAQHGDVWRAEITLVVEGELFRAEASGESINAAIDAVKDEMLTRLRRTKDKRFALMRRTGAQIKKWTRFGKE